MKHTVLVIDSLEKKLIDVVATLRRQAHIVHYIMMDNLKNVDLKHMKFDVTVVYFNIEDPVATTFIEENKNRSNGGVKIVLCSYDESDYCKELIIEESTKIMLYSKWNQDAVLDAIQRVFSYKELVGRDNLEIILDKIKQVPTLPDIYFDVNKMIVEKADMDLISKRIESDVAIASRILRIANSAYYGARTGSIHQALMFLGTENIKNIIISMVVFDNQSTVCDVKVLWQHAELTNKLANYIYYIKHMRSMPASYSSVGLLHSIGLVLLLTVFSDSYLPVIEQLNQTSETLEELEKRVLNYTHTDLGGVLLDWWNLPPGLIYGAFYYRRPLETEPAYAEITCIVHLASHLSWKILGDTTFIGALDQEALDYLKISDHEVEQIMQNYQAK
ncbi:MAG: hypothetical protein CSB19_01965 [Clostridiales bacterium]|nr:MAG: hypothetical protein CSB19_01965 [Clostridiales bacterium]